MGKQKTRKFERPQLVVIESTPNGEAEAAKDLFASRDTGTCGNGRTTITMEPTDTIALASAGPGSGRHQDLRLSHLASVGLRRLTEGLRPEQVRLANGKLINPNFSTQYLNYLLERIADPRVKRIELATD